VVTVALMGLLAGVGVTPAQAGATSFGPAAPWVSHPVYGTHGILITGLTDCANRCTPGVMLMVRSDGIWDPLGHHRYTGSYYGQIGTYLANGTSGQSVYVVNRTGIVVRAFLPGFDAPSTFGPIVTATKTPFYGQRTTAFADVTGDGNSDAIAVSNDGIYVMPAHADGTLSPRQKWTPAAAYGQIGTFFADVNGDGKADAIMVNNNGTTVRLSNGASFGAPGPRNDILVDAANRLAFADVTGDGRDDAIRFANSRVYVYPSLGTGFGQPQAWTTAPYFGQLANMVALDGGGGTDPLIWGAFAFDTNEIYLRQAFEGDPSGG
jgi:hypothetical protein